MPTATALVTTLHGVLLSWLGLAGETNRRAHLQPRHPTPQACGCPPLPLGFPGGGPPIFILIASACALRLPRARSAWIRLSRLAGLSSRSSPSASIAWALKSKPAISLESSANSGE